MSRNRAWPAWPLFLLMLGCSGTVAPPAGSTLPASSTRFFAVAYEQITDKYLTPVALATLVGGGLEGLSAIDPSLKVAMVQGRALVTREQLHVASFVTPTNDDAWAWARLTAAVVGRAQTVSPPLAAATPTEIHKAVLTAALGRLDPYSRYSGPEEAREAKAFRDGFGGVGLTIDVVDNGVRVESVTPDSPASRAGIRPGDRITLVDGRNLLGLELREIVRRLRGPIGAPVELEIAREGLASAFTVSLSRARIVPETVTARREGQVLVVKVAGFNQRTGSTLTEALRRSFRDSGGPPAGVVLDLRGNLGGILDQAVAVADLFLEEGPIVSTQGRRSGSSQLNEAEQGDPGEHLPVVVVVNNSSASAAEIVAAALQDQHRAVVLGTVSFGKGSVQTVINLPDEGELVLTWARYHAPSGYSLDELGVLPDICTSGAPDSAEAILAAVRQGQITTEATLAEWRSADHHDKARLRALRARCQPEARQRDGDIEAARRLLLDRPLMAEVMKGTTVTARVR